MSLDELDPNTIRKLVSEQVEQATCLQCCKYYIAPATATCGHTLCHSCWSGRRSCPTCSAPFERKKLKLNLLLQSLTEHIHCLADAFEKLFNVNLNDIEFDVHEEVSDPTKHVKEWLASSENHFSAPVSSQQSTHETVPPVQVDASEIQIHSEIQKNPSTVSIVHAPQPKEDWDKIEVLPDTEEINTKSKEPESIDFEPFFIGDEYNTDNPRRSSRKKEMKTNSVIKKRDISSDKISKHSSTDTDKHLLKTKQNWSSVKKMRKEFGKLNKKKNKLNVSIEMCKKAQSKAKQQATTLSEVIKQPVYNIIDDTPDIIKESSPHNPTASDKENVNINITPVSNNTDEKHLNSHSKNEDKLHQETNISKTKSVRTSSIEMDVDKNKQTTIENSVAKVTDKLSSSTGKDNSSTKDVTKAKMPFIKKSNLHQPPPPPEENAVEITQNEVDTKTLTTNNEDIEISIKIGNTITNIVIRKKNNDVQLKLNTDREVQATLGPHELSTRNDVACSPINVQNIELNVGDGNKVEVNKSMSTKKNTASADTATAQFEITDSVERELSNVMECVVPGSSKKTPKKKSQLINKSKQESGAKIQNDEIPEDIHMEDLDDLDLFNSGSVKETEVQLLKNTKPLQSEVLISSSMNKRTQKLDKRDREVDDDVQEIPCNKKQKLDEKRPNMGEHKKQGDFNDESIEVKSSSQMQDSENINYDAIMGQVFANIDADIRNSQKVAKDTQAKSKQIDSIDADIQHNQKIVKDAQSKAKEIDSRFKVDTQFSQIINKTQKKNPSAEIQNISINKDLVNEKYSENMFSMLEKDSEPVEATPKSKQQQPTENTQQRIDKLLTPDVCRNLVETREDNSQTDAIDVDMMEQELGTPAVPLDEDIVEETPQKNLSISKPKKSESSNKPFVKPLDKEKPNEPTQMSDSQIIKSIINISDTDDTRKTREMTVIENPRETETPLTISKFVNRIQHNSTPVARKSLNFESEDPEQTLCPTTTQEKEIMEKAFEQTQKTPPKKIAIASVEKFVVAGSCLAPFQLANVKKLCNERGWTFVDKYTDALTHLVVGVDEDNVSQRSIKYMCALAASKFIVEYGWVVACLMKKAAVDEALYEALDSCGEPGPQRSRLAIKKLFDGFTFYCLPPFTILDVGTLTQILQSAGGKVVASLPAISIKDDIAPKILLAEPEQTEGDQFMYIAMQYQVVPVNYEWALNCLGAYKLYSIHELLLCPVSLLPKNIISWPSVLIEREEND